jgi:hypothetical protein
VLLYSLVPSLYIYDTLSLFPNFFWVKGEFFIDFLREKLPVNDNNVLACKLFLHTYAMWWWFLHHPDMIALE